MNSFSARLNNRMESMRHKRRIQKAIRALTPSEFVHHPEPTTPGNYARGLRLLNGEIFVENHFHNIEGSIWDYHYPSEYFYDRFQAFDWMDDLAAVSTTEAGRKMREWTYQWIERFGRGDASGWRADLMGWRIIRMITHATTLLADSSGVQSERYFESLGIQVNYLKEVTDEARDGLPKSVGLVAWLFAALSLDSFHDDMAEVVALIDAECAHLVDQGQLYFDARNPEELSQIFSLLVWADLVLEENGQSCGKYHDAALDTLGQALRTLRFGGHRLLAAHGGGFGDPDEIDRALTHAQIMGSSSESLVLGFQNIRLGLLNAFIDADAPPSGSLHEKTHASTLGLWVAERDQVLICAGGAPLQAPLVKRVEMQETAAHSAMVIDAKSSSHLSLLKDKSKSFTIGAGINQPAQVYDRALTEDDDAIHFQATHDGYVKDFGYLHQRKIVFYSDGLFFGGVDILSAPTPQAERKVKSTLATHKAHGIPLDIFFHLGPGLEPSLDNNGEWVSFASQAGHIWVFKQEGGKIDIVESEYYFPDRLNPTPSKSIVIRTRLMDSSGYVSWSFQAYPDH